MLHLNLSMVRARNKQKQQYTDTNMFQDLVKQRFLINNVSFTPPTVPVLLQILSGNKAAQDLLP